MNLTFGAEDPSGAAISTTHGRNLNSTLTVRDLLHILLLITFNIIARSLH